jgi:hypothetical protein
MEFVQYPGMDEKNDSTRDMFFTVAVARIYITEISFPGQQTFRICFLDTIKSPLAHLSVHDSLLSFLAVGPRKKKDIQLLFN